MEKTSKIKVTFKKHETQSLIPPTLINVRVTELRKRGFDNYNEWSERPNSLYIGRYMRIGGQSGIILIPQSKWHNPFKLSKDKNNIDEVLQQYEDHIRHSSLYNDLHELSGKEMGCWCKGLNPCHGDILIKLFKEKFQK